MITSQTPQFIVSSRWINVLAFSAFVLIVLGVKLWMINAYANATPFWDQWDAEADYLYRPWMEGSLTWHDLIVPHNEHRIFTTRLLGLLLLELNGGIWDPVLQMTVNAILHVISLSVLLYYLAKALPEMFRPALFFLCSALFAIPFDWENTLAGFQSQFYFFLLFSFFFLWAMVSYRPFGVAWWFGLASGLLSILSLASGVLSMAAGLGVILIRWIAAGERGTAQLVAMLLLFLFALTSLLLTPDIAGHASLKAQSSSDFITGLTQAMSWPIGGIGLLVLHAPLFAFMFQMLLSKTHRSTSRWFIFALALWLVGQFVALSYGRFEAVTTSRYLDILAIGLVLNLVCIGIFIGDSCSRFSAFYRYGGAIWVVLLAVSFASESGQIFSDIQVKAQQGKEQEINVRVYLLSHNMDQLADKPFMHVPYPSAERLKSLLDNPTIEAILPGNIFGHNARQPPSLLKGATSFLVANYVYLIALGISAFGILVMMTCASGKDRNEPGRDVSG